MKRMLAAIFAGYICCGLAQAGDSACAVAEPLVVADFGLPKVADAIARNHRVDVVVMGTGSSVLTGPGGVDIGYPAKLQAAFAARLPGVEVRIVSRAKGKATAAQMAAEFGRMMAEVRPNLVIWQTGTFDAMSGVDPDDFFGTLDDGLETLTSAGAEVILMNMQYSPRTELMIGATPYADALRRVALQRDILLFDRLAIMKHWSELGTFDLYGATKNLETAAHVHDCIAQLLADLVVKGIKVNDRQPLLSR